MKGQTETLQKSYKPIATATIGTLAVAALVGTGCEMGEDRYASWLATDGASGRINMSEVNDALKSCKDPSELEKRVNEIYEGKNPVLIKVERLSDGRKQISGYEDLDNDKKINPAKDDMLFSAVVGEKDYDLKGAGANSYYRHHGRYDMMDMLMFHWMMSSWRTPVYMTSPTRVGTIVRERTVHRQSPSYKTQQQKNRTYQTNAKAANPQTYSKAASTKSSARASYHRSTQRTMVSFAGRSGGRSGGRSSGVRGGS